MGLEQLPWEQNERSLQVNTYIENIPQYENTPNTKGQTKLDVEISKSPKVEIFIEYSVHDKDESSKNQKSDNSRSDECEETKVFDKKGTTKSKKDLNKANLSKILEDDKDSFLLDLSSPDIIANDEELYTPKEKNNFSKTDNKLKRNSKCLKKLSLDDDDDDDIAPKKLKISSPNEIKNNDENLVDKDVSLSILNPDVKSLCSRSPSLFDESLNLDTQICDILEQNVMNIAHLSGLEDSKVFANELNTEDTKKCTSPNTDNAAQICKEENVKSVNTANLQSRNSILSWGDDSWNYSEGLLKQVAQDNDQNIKKEVCKPTIKNIVNINTPKNVKTCVQSNKESVCKTDVKKATTAVNEKALRKINSPKAAESPVASVIVFRNERRISADSNKTDSEDIIIDSQHIESSLSNNKSRTRTQLEKIRKMRSQKLTEDITTEVKNYLNSPRAEILNDTMEDKSNREVKPKLKDILARNMLFAASHSANNIVYDSKDEATIDSQTRSISNTKKLETESNICSKSTKSKIEITLQPDNKKDLSSEVIDWNTLNIVKVASDRATFNLFKREILKKKYIALALHCDMYVNSVNKIGSKICPSDAGKQKSRRSGSYTHGNKEIRGVAISWESNIAYYISLGNSQGNGKTSKLFLFIFSNREALFFQRSFIH